MWTELVKLTSNEDVTESSQESELQTFPNLLERLFNLREGNSNE